MKSKTKIVKHGNEAELKCPHVIRKRAGDESWDMCELNANSCLKEHGLYKCDIYEEYLNEQTD